MNAAGFPRAATALVLARPSPAAMAINVIAFQVGWFACVLGAAYGTPWIGTAVAIAVVSVHLARSIAPGAELKLIGAAVLIGAVWDSMLAASGWLAFNPGSLEGGYAPHWILGLWALFATTLNVSLGWLQGRWLLATVLGAFAGPLSYWGGARLGALTLVEPVPALAALAIGWAVFMPALMALARRYDGVHPGRRSAT